MREYIHYGHKEFDINKFKQIKNESFWTKPYGGLWASPIDAQNGWKQWCEDNEFRDCNESNSFKFTITETANIQHIYSIEDICNLPNIELSKEDISISKHLIDFENALNSGVDGIELHLSEEKDYDNYMDSLYYALYGWDCDSIIILNPEVIIPIIYREPLV